VSPRSPNDQGPHRQDSSWGAGPVVCARRMAGVERVLRGGVLCAGWRGGMYERAVSGTRPGLRSGFVAAPSVVSSADSARGLGCVPDSWRTRSAAVVCGTCDRSVSPIGGAMGPLMRTLTRLVEHRRGCLRSTHEAHAPLMGSTYHDPSTSSPTGTKPTPIPRQARPTRIGYAFADRLLTYPHASNLSVSRLPALRIVGCGGGVQSVPGIVGSVVGRRPNTGARLGRLINQNSHVIWVP